ncbi:MAG: DUF1292 domain-containing protein [Firmicutes bacterium HGW-Firmicutes-5]|nr:MAG: DUF1292 domain-containing protein [Firmicutes bacterium HGW-Firmicutes-5]
MSEDNMKDLSNENCGDGCGCGHDHEDHHHDTITLTMENNEQVECAVLGIFEVENQEYVALLPEDSEDVFIYIYKEDEDGEIELENIESQEDFDKISAAFLEIMEEEEEEA